MMMPYTATVLLLLAMGGTVAPVHAAEEVTEPEEFEEQEDMMYNNSWWHAAHEAMVERMEHDPDATSPENELMNDFELYLGEILHIYGQEDPGEKDRSQELLGIVSKQYKHIEWTAQPFADEYMPPAEGGEHDIEEHSEEMTPIDLIAHYLNEIFFHYKTKEEAEAMVKFLDTLAPGAPAKHKRMEKEEEERVAALSEEQYAEEFGVTREGIPVEGTHIDDYEVGLGEHENSAEAEELFPAPDHSGHDM